MSRCAVVVLALVAGCAEVEENDADRPDPGAPPVAHPMVNGVLAAGRPGDEEAARVVFEVLGAPTNTIPVVTWVEGVPCPARPDRGETIPFGDECYQGLTWELPEWCVPYVVWPHGHNERGGTLFAHELAHCASLRLGLGLDTDHSGWIWSEVDAAEAALVAAGL